VLEQTLYIAASQFTEGNAAICPTGRILPVAGTAMDFTTAKPIGQDINADDPQVVQAGGYDHNYVLDKEPGELTLAAVAKSAKTGIVMETYTTQPGIQLYTGNFLKSDQQEGKTGFHHKNQGFCLETQHFPCAPSHPHFPSIVLRPGQVYHQVTQYRFAVEEG
jgi:aldose 1-epimerase